MLKDIIIFGFFLLNILMAEVQAKDLKLIPFPQEIALRQGSFALSENICIFVTENDADIFAAKQLQNEIAQRVGLKLELNPVPELLKAIPPCLILSSAQPQKIENLLDDRTKGTEAYVLSIQPAQVIIQSSGEAGLFYGVQTLRQIIRQGKSLLPSLLIHDWPALRWRGTLDDITRGPSPLLATLKEEVRLGAFVKMNFLTFNQEEQYAFEKYPDIWPKNGSLTKQELKELNDYAKQYHITIIGNQQSFGHFNDILKIPKYQKLAENQDVLSPALEETYDFLTDLYSEQVPYTDAPFFGVDSDEVGGLGEGPAKELVEKYGVGEVYARHLRRLHDIIKEKWNRRIMMWGDIILRHPAQLTLIPQDTIMLTWGYGAKESFSDQIIPFAEAGYDFFVCPGVSCWNRVPPDFSVANINIKNFVRDGIELGAMGMMNTMWDDYGENLFNLNWYEILWGAECSWKGAGTEIYDFNSRIGTVLFGEEEGNFGEGMELLTEAVRGDSGSISKFWNCKPMLNGWDKPPFNISARSFREAREKIKGAQEKRRKYVAGNVYGVEEEAELLLDLVEPALSSLQKARKDAIINAYILDYFIFGAERLKLMAQRELAFVEEYYAEDREEIIKNYANLKEEYARSKETYQNLWNRESKPYALDWVLNRYAGVIEYYEDLIKHL